MESDFLGANTFTDIWKKKIGLILAIKSVIFQI